MAAAPATAPAAYGTAEAAPESSSRMRAASALHCCSVVNWMAAYGTYSSCPASVPRHSPWEPRAFRRGPASKLGHQGKQHGTVPPVLAAACSR